MITANNDDKSNTTVLIFSKKSELNPNLATLLEPLNCKNVFKSDFHDTGYNIQVFISISKNWKMLLYSIFKDITKNIGSDNCVVIESCKRRNYFCVFGVDKSGIVNIAPQSLATTSRECFIHAVDEHSSVEEVKNFTDTLRTEVFSWLSGVADISREDTDCLLDILYTNSITNYF